MWDWLRDENNRGALQVIGGAFAAIVVAGWAIYRAQPKGKRFVDSWVFITSCGLVACLAIIAGAYGIALRFSQKPASGSKSISEVQRTERLVKDPRLDWAPNGRVSLQGRFSRAGGPVNIYVTYGSPNSSLGMNVSPRQVLGGKLNVEPRIKIGSVSSFDKDERIDITIGFVSDVEGNQQVIQWGEPSQNNTKVGITWGAYFGWIIMVWDEGRDEEPYPLAIISTVQPVSSGSATAVPPLFVGPDILITHSRLGSK